MKEYKRLESIRVVVDTMLNQMRDLDKRRSAFIHLYGVSLTASLLALKRGLDPELAGIMGILHDYYYYKTGIKELHAYNTAEIVRTMLRNIDLFSEKEQKLIRIAIFNHSDKESIQEEYSELLKDADIFQRYLYNTNRKVYIRNAKRLKKILEELSLESSFEVVEKEKVEEVNLIRDKRALLAQLAKSYAQKEIEGLPSDEDFNCILKYWPIEDAYNELKNNWSAAFVYHCVQTAGFTLPIRHPNGVGLFTGVDAWLEWALLEDSHFFHPQDEDGFIPSSGDLVIFISEDDQDQIGIVLEYKDDSIVIAEGNINNENKSGIAIRNSSENISGYIRIDPDYQFTFNGHYSAPIS